jgi:uncharacterized RDD family membrane protein YckC
MESNDSILSDITPEEAEVGMMQGFFTRLFDFAIDILMLFLVYLVMSRDVIFNVTRSSSIVIPCIIIAGSTVYRFLFLLLFNKTIGMMLCKVKLLNKDLQPLSPKEKLISIFRSRFSSIKYYKDI